MDRLHVHAFSYNNEMLIPYFLRHYKTFADKIYLWDFHSTDHTVEFALQDDSGRVFVSSIGRPGVFDEETVTGLSNTLYKRSRHHARRVAVVDLDEFLWHPDMRGLLLDYEERSITLPKIQAYQMVGSKPPTTTGQIYDEIKDGFKDAFYNRRAIFDPWIDINYEYGCDHGCNPAPRMGVNLTESEVPDIKLLHYNFFGEDRWVEKYTERAARMSEHSRDNGLGTVYHMETEDGPITVPLVPADEESLREGYRTLLRGRKLERVVP